MSECQRRPHYGEACDCAARLAQVITHTRTSTGGYGPDFCAECSEAISEWVPWPCEAKRSPCGHAVCRPWGVCQFSRNKSRYRESEEA